MTPGHSSAYHTPPDFLDEAASVFDTMGGGLISCEVEAPSGVGAA